MRCLHPVKTKLLAASVPLTLENASAVGTVHTDAGGRISSTGLTVAVKRLVPAAQARELVHNYCLPSQAVGPTAPSRHWIGHSTPESVGAEQVWYLYPLMRLYFDININERFDFVCWNETEEQRTEGARDVTHMNTHTNAQWNRPPGWRGQSPTQSRTQPRTNAMILISNLHLSLTSNISKNLDINHDINIKVCKHMIEFNIK